MNPAVMILNINKGTFRFLFHLLVIVIVTVVIPVISMKLWQEGDVTFLPGFPFFPLQFLMIGLFTTLIYFMNSYWFVPYFLMKEKYGNYLFALISATGLSYIFMQYLNTWFWNIGYSHSMLIPVFPMILITGLGTSFEFIVNFDERRRKEKEIEGERIAAELFFLKGQINPHFLFNSLNSIYSLSEKTSGKTSETILLLSEILRFVLYETDRGKIPIQKEVRHLENYISMQRLRLSEFEEIVIKFQHEKSLPGDVLIEPLLLIPFVENAFKHGISYSRPTIILIILSVYNGKVHFRVKNSKKIPSLQRNGDFQGIGISNVRRRLDLIYSNQYSLEILDEYEFFTIELILPVTVSGFESEKRVSFNQNC